MSNLTRTWAPWATGVSQEPWSAPKPSGAQRTEHGAVLLQRVKVPPLLLFNTLFWQWRIWRVNGLILLFQKSHVLLQTWPKVTGHQLRMGTIERGTSSRSIATPVTDWLAPPTSPVAETADGPLASHNAHQYVSNCDWLWLLVWRHLNDLMACDFSTSRPGTLMHWHVKQRYSSQPSEGWNRLSLKLHLLPSKTKGSVIKAAYDNALIMIYFLTHLHEITMQTLKSSKMKLKYRMFISISVLDSNKYKLFSLQSMVMCIISID